MQHANSPLTPNGRRRMVLLVVEEGFTKSTCWEWIVTSSPAPASSISRDRCVFASRTQRT